MSDLVPNPRVAILGDDAIVFDLLADRYLAMPGAVDAATGRLRPEAIELLIAGGVAKSSDAIGLSNLRKPVRTMAVTERRVRLSDYVELALALVRAGTRMARGRHVSRFADGRNEWISQNDEKPLREALGKLRRMRLFLPTPSRCLPAALTAAFYLSSLELEVDLVFGVRAHPFDAHCWLEWNGMVLDDDLDRVSAYTPIAVGRV